MNIRIRQERESNRFGALGLEPIIPDLSFSSS